jgi:hypothetical protein
MSTVPGSLDIKGGRIYNFLLNKRWNLFLPFCLTNPAQESQGRKALPWLTVTIPVGKCLLFINYVLKTSALIWLDLHKN